MAEDLNALELFRASLVIAKRPEHRPPQPYGVQIAEALKAGTLDAEGSALLLAFALERLEHVEAIKAEAMDVLRRDKASRYPNERDAVGRDAVKLLRRLTGEA